MALYFTVFEQINASRVWETLVSENNFIFSNCPMSWEDLLGRCSYHFMYGFQSESTLYSCLNVKELLVRSRREKKWLFFRNISFSLWPGVSPKMTKSLIGDHFNSLKLTLKWKYNLKAILFPSILSFVTWLTVG